MPGIDTAMYRVRLQSVNAGSDLLFDCFDEIDRLKAENQRLTDEIESVLQLMDGLAEQWGDEAVFRRCRDRLRALTKEAGE